MSDFRKMVNKCDFPVVEINISDKNSKNKGLVSEYSLVLNEDNNLSEGIIDFVNINLAYFDKNEYSKDELRNMTALERLCLIFKVRNREMLDALVEVDENLMEIKKIYEDIVNDKEFVEEYTKEELERLALAENSASKRNIEIAKSMLKDKMDVNVISKYTGLSVSQIEEISLD